MDGVAAAPAGMVIAPVVDRVVNAPAAGVVPPIAPGDGNETTFALPSKLLPPIVLAVVSVAALPVVLWFRVGNVQFVSVPLDGVPSAPPG